MKTVFGFKASISLLLTIVLTTILSIGVAQEESEFVFAHSGPIRTMDAPVTWFGSTHWLTNTLYDCLIWRKPDNSGYVGQAA